MLSTFTSQLVAQRSFPLVLIWCCAISTLLSFSPFCLSVEGIPSPHGSATFFPQLTSCTLLLPSCLPPTVEILLPLCRSIFWVFWIIWPQSSCVWETGKPRIPLLVSHLNLISASCILASSTENCFIVANGKTSLFSMAEKSHYACICIHITYVHCIIFNQSSVDEYGFLHSWATGGITWGCMYLFESVLLYPLG